MIANVINVDVRGFSEVAGIQKQMRMSCGAVVAITIGPMARMNKVEIEMWSEMKSSLLAVIDVLRNVPNEQFNMQHWWLEDGMAFDEERNVMYKVADGPCGCKVAEFLFSQYSYLRRPINREDVIRRIEFVIGEIGMYD